MPGDRIRQLTKRVREEIAQHTPAKPKDETSASDSEPRTGRANPLPDTGPRVPPQAGPHKKR